MDRMFSTRIDEETLARLHLLSQRLRMSKKRIIEEAILAFACRAEDQEAVDPLKQTSGAWEREETPEETLVRGRTAFRASMRRHHE